MDFFRVKIEVKAHRFCFQLTAFSTILHGLKKADFSIKNAI